MDDRSKASDGSRGRLRAHPAAQDRAARPSALSRFASSQGGIALRGALHMWLGPMLTVGALLFFIFGIGRHWHG